MNKLKWTFDLKQHTPMIHFQPSDDACLRATEVKPKFDRFLLENECFTKDQKSKWFYTSDDGRLATKMKLRFNTKGKIFRKKNINKLYFGNQGCKAKEDYKESVFFKGGVQGMVLCFDGELLEIVKRYIPVFFLLNNFGTRQNKGFGSFSVVGGAVKGSEYDVIRKYEPNAFCLDYNSFLEKGQTISKEERLDDIGILYGLMKGGIYNKKRRIKSAIFRYYLEKGMISEKEVIKQYLFDEKSIEEIDIENAYYVRAALGLTDRFVYKDAIRKGTVSVSNNVIARYQSPVYFKVLKRYTFLFLRPMPDALRNAEFMFTLNKRKKKLPVPDFDIEDFMDWFALDFNNKEEIVDPSTGELVRESLKKEENDKFVRIEQLELRRCGG